ncbi:hypothetical protein BH10ACT1_BH10ACT1_42910 [soil metagenome]
MELSFYAAPGPLTELTGEQAAMVRGLSDDAVELCRAVQGLLIAPGDAFGAGLSEARLTERNTRPATALLQQALELDASPLDHPRSTHHRVVGTCRHYAVLATAFLRAAGFPARARCGFASYFVPSKHVDHWIAEHWDVDEDRWVRIDAEILGTATVARPHDLRPGEFLTGGESWATVRTGALDAMDFGVFGTENWGPGEIRGNLMRDLASLHKIETLPWDEWGPMNDSYEGRTDEHFDQLMDEVAIACSGDDDAALDRTYQQLRVPADLIC